VPGAAKALRCAARQALFARALPWRKPLPGLLCALCELAGRRWARICGALAWCIGALVW